MAFFELKKRKWWILIPVFSFLFLFVNVSYSAPPTKYVFELRVLYENKCISLYKENLPSDFFRKTGESTFEKKLEVNEGPKIVRGKYFFHVYHSFDRVGNLNKIGMVIEPDLPEEERNHSLGNSINFFQGDKFFFVNRFIDHNDGQLEIRVYQEGIL
jgi:hypothetical protein